MLDFDIESSSDEEPPQPSPKVTQKQIKTTTKTKAQDVNVNQPIINSNSSREKVREVKEHFNTEKVKQTKKTETPVVAKPVEQPKVVYENNSSVNEKPEINPTKTKPFKMKETPKSSSKKTKTVRKASSEEESSSPRSKRSSIKSNSKPPARREVEKPSIDIEQERLFVEKELDMPQKKFQMNKNDDKEIKVLSNTQLIENTQEVMDNNTNQHIRKSMNNLRLNDDSSSKSSVEDNLVKSVSKKSPYSKSKQQIKPQMNNSNSQSSLSKVSNFAELSNQNYTIQNGYINDASKRHETIKIEKQTTKPLMPKSNSMDDYAPNFGKQSESANFIKPNLTQPSNKSRDFTTSKTEIEEDKHFQPIVTPQSIRIEKQVSSSEEEPDEDNEEEEDQNQSDEEYPVALNQLIYSFLPQDIAEDMNNRNDWKKRTAAIQKFEGLIKKQLSTPSEDFPIYVSDI